ncbi:uncharacterized protein MONOS_18355 [Monocercomonoides exilis]|uniref:uncharacterized protein n=1 Tax=Monocercomonoides exilis TaxID=2049356 RepID=UPI003559FA57|nr:hypothetical protein MONOS_18355 [Monocercomonoides exilis]
MDGLRERERGKSGESERLGEASAAQAAQMVHSAAALIPSYSPSLMNEEKKGEERKVRVRLREREGNGWVERKREERVGSQRGWERRVLHRGCTDGAQRCSAHPFYSPSLLRMKCGREGSWGREENEGEREVREGREKE